MSQKFKKPFRPVGKISRLQFSEEERTDPTLEKPMKKAVKAADKMEKAQANIPQQKKLTRERTLDADTGEPKVHLYFEDIDKPKPPSKLSRKIKNIPQRELMAKIHKEIRESESDNVGVESAHKSEQALEFVARRMQSAYHSHKLKPYRQLARAERTTAKAEINYLYKKSLRDNPESTSNPLSKWQQKRAIKKQYAAARFSRSANTAASVSSTAKNKKATAKTTAKATDKVVQFITKNKKVFLILAAIGLLVVFISNINNNLTIIFAKQEQKKKRCDPQKAATLFIQYSILFGTFIRPLFRLP